MVGDIYGRRLQCQRIVTDFQFSTTGKSLGQKRFWFLCNMTSCYFVPY